MDIRKVDECFAVAPQIHASDMGDIAAQGYAAIICNRPDGEEPGQPAVASLRAAAEAAGLSFHHLPISSGHFSRPSINAFRAVRKGTEGPILAYCRTGTRCISLEMLANVNQRTVDERLRIAKAAGYDLSGLLDSVVN